MQADFPSMRWVNLDGSSSSSDRGTSVTLVAIGVMMEPQIPMTMIACTVSKKVS